ncbi:Uncharacterised protein [Pseudomonas aeruginosa]|nr:Uncharacterised protein [Pseudomonas aeruginosa]
MEQRHVLRQVADTALAVGRVDLGQADVVQQQASRLRVEQAAEQAQQGRLAGAVAAEQRHPLAGADVQGLHVDHRRAVAVGQAHALQAVMSLQALLVHEALALGSLLLGAHQLVEAFHRHLGVLPATEDAGRLRQRCDGPRGEDRAGHQAADGHRALADPIDAEDHHADVAELLDDARRVAQGRGQGMGLHRRTGQFAGQGFPLVQAAAFGAGRLDRLQVLEGFPAARRSSSPLRAGSAATGGPSRRWVSRPRQDHQHAGHQRHPDHMAADHGDDQQEDRHERQVADQRRAGRGKELAHRLELPHLGTEGAHRRRLGGDPGAQHAGEQQGRELQVEALARAR